MISQNDAKSERRISHAGVIGLSEKKLEIFQKKSKKVLDIC